MLVDIDGLVSEAVKAEIVAASSKSGIVIAEVAKSYGITPRQIYSWRYTHKRSQKRRQSRLAGKFVELVPQRKVPPSGSGKISGVSLRFANCTLSIDGSISAACLSQLIEIMGSQC